MKYWHRIEIAYTKLANSDLFEDAKTMAEVKGKLKIFIGDRFEVPLGYNEGVEGIISISSGSDLTLNIYDNDGDLYSSYSVGSGSPIGFSFQSDTFTMEITPSNTDVLTEYFLS